MRLIDADALKEKCFGKRGGIIHTADVDKAPTIVAFPVVRCKDCKWQNDGECEHNLALVAAFDDNYCSYAVRREDSHD